MSTIDQRPMTELARWIHARRRGRQRHRPCAANSRKASDTIFTAGTTMLATKMITAITQEPVRHMYWAPLRIVSLWVSKSEPL